MKNNSVSVFNSRLRQVVLCLVLTLSLFNSSPAFALGRCGYWFSRLFGFTASRTLQGEAKASYEAALKAKQLKKYTFLTLFESEKLDFIDAMDAAKQAHSGQISLKHYIAQRRIGKSHQDALIFSSKDRFYAAAAGRMNPTDAMALSQSVQRAAPSLAAKYFKSKIGPSETRDALFQKILDVYDLARNKEIGVDEARDLTAFIAEKIHAQSGSWHIPVISGVLHNRREKELNNQLANYLEMRTKGISPQDSAELVFNDGKPHRQIYNRLVNRLKLSPTEVAEVAQAYLTKEIVFDLYYKLRRSGKSHTQAMALSSSNHFLADAHLAGLDKAEANQLVGELRKAHPEFADRFFSIPSGGKEALRVKQANQILLEPYVLATKHGIPPTEARALSLKIFETLYDKETNQFSKSNPFDKANTYLKARQEQGLSESEALDVISKTDYPGSYFKTRKAGFNHEEALKISNYHNSDSYITALAAGATPSEAREVANQSPSAEAYVKAKANGMDHHQAMTTISAHPDSPEYAELIAMGVSHEEADEAVDNLTNIDEYVRARKQGIPHNDAYEAAELNDTDAYFRFRAIQGVSHSDAYEAANDLSDTDTYAKAREKGVPHADAYEAANELTDPDGYFRSLEIPHVTPAEAFEAANDLSDMDSYETARKMGLPHDEAYEVANELGDTEQYFTLRAIPNVTHSDALEAMDGLSDMDTYVKGRKRGLSHSESYDVTENITDPDTYFRLRRIPGVTHEDAYYVMENVPRIGRYANARKAGKTHSEACAIADD